jgi:hypothetical protein
VRRPDHEKPVMILPVGYPAETATVPAVAKRKKPLDEDPQRLPLVVRQYPRRAKRRGVTGARNRRLIFGLGPGGAGGVLG